MRRAYLTDHDGVGGGMEYIRRQMAAHPDNDCRVFCAARVPMARIRGRVAYHAKK